MGRLLSAEIRQGPLWFGLNTRKHVKELIHPWVVGTVKFSPDGKMFATGDWLDDKALKIWDAKNNEVIHELEAGKVDDIAFSSNGKFLASGSLDVGLVRIWDPDKGELLQTFETGMEHVLGVVFADKDSKVVCGGSDGIQVWDLKSGKLLNTLPKQRDPDTVECLALNPDGRLLAAGRRDTIINLWDLKTATLVDTLVGSSARVNSVAFSPDGRTLVSGSEISDGLLWETEPLDKIDNNNFSVDPKNKVAVFWADMKQ